ncbi:MAG: CoA-binding protein [Desulfobacteraceae bacterium]|nr:CoA-binding protein [Desulfobacteraceae bacterium]
MIPSSIEESTIYPIANPGSIAFFGASNNFSAMGTGIMGSILSLGYKGALYPIHPKEENVQGIRAFKQVSDLDHTPDLAFIVLPTKIVCQTLEACGQKGIRHAIIVSAGFNEVGGNGKKLQNKLTAVAEKYGIRFLGPNCIGVVNSHQDLNATFLPYEASRGFIGMASQSGSFITQMFSYLKRAGTGFSTGFSVGNEASVDIVDCMEYLGACPHTKVIALYIESIRRGRAFIDAARAITPHKPIVAFYVGGSEEGGRAGFSHTGALAGPDPLYNGVFRQSGIIRARSIEEMFDFCHALGACPPAPGNRVIIQTHSGGPGAVAADACGRNGLKLPPLSPETLKKLKPFVPRTASMANPVDLTFSKNPLDFFRTIPGILLGDENADSLLAYFLASADMIRMALKGLGVPEDQVEEQTDAIITQQAQAMADLGKNSPKPVIGYSFLTRDDSRLIRALQDAGMVILPSPERGARAMWALTEYQRLRKKLPASA